MRLHFIPRVFVSLLACWGIPALADTPHIHTSRPSPKVLPLPKGDDVYHFIVFGDRTGGPPEGIRILAQAVEDTNLLDPDLVMTVGDLINGYNQTPEWMAQMEEFHATMSKLKMPWFPVAGNHDIYWRRSARDPEAKPPSEHEDHYEKHFGPLWYWFEHKKTGFLILFSDEGQPDGRVRSFSDPGQQKISDEQKDWIAIALDEMKHLQHVFVFLHHPYWWGERYPGNNWDTVHQLLIKNSNVRAVLAGHIHQMRYDGQRDGIDYYALATTGGSLTPGMQYQHFGLLHHFNVVTVRSNGYSMASIPVGGVFDPKQFDPARMADVEAARYLLHEFVSPPIQLNLNGSAAAIYEVAITNPCTLSIDVTVLAQGDASWVLAPSHRHATLRPGERTVFEFACGRESTESLDDYEAPEFVLQFDVLTDNARLPMTHRSKRAKTMLVPPGAGWPGPPPEDHAFAFNGRDACLEIDKERIPQLETFTLEAWVKPSGSRDGGLVSNLSSGGFGLDVADGVPRFSVRLNQAFLTVKAPDQLPSSWTHLAGVYDGTQMSLYVNGNRVASAPARGTVSRGDKSLYIGARPNTAWNEFNFSFPTGFWNGAVNDVRLSRGARYKADFTPPHPLPSDTSTLFAMSNDRQFGPFVPVLAEPPFQAATKGDVTRIKN